MKKRLFALIVGILMLVTASCHAATYTLPEKMHNQLAIGSGLKGTFTITAEGKEARTPFLDAVTDAEFSIRGMLSGEDFHYYVFQTDSSENQTALTELYRKEGICYFRSDMVQGKVLAFPTSVQLTDSILPAKGGNPSLASAIVNILLLSENERKDKWEPMLSRYQNELEMWLADFTVQADIVKLDNGSSALDFTYVIPVSALKEEMLTIFGEFISDPEVQALLDTVMTPEQKSVYANSNLQYYYEEALNSLDLDREVRMSKRVSAMGVVLSSSIELPLDQRTTGYQTLSVENADKLTVIRLQGEQQTIAIAYPTPGEESASEYEKSYWITRITANPDHKTGIPDFAVRVDVRKTSRVYDDNEEKSHQEDQYTVTVQRDTRYVPETADASDIPEMKDIKAELSLHYSSKFSQSSATSLEIRATVQQDESKISFEGKLKTSAPWVFMPFEVIDPITVGTDNISEIISYATDWISNAGSMIHHETKTTSSEPADPEEPSPAEPTEEPAEEAEQSSGTAEAEAGDAPANEP